MTTRTIDQGEEIVISYGYGNRQERSNDGKWWHCGQICYWNQDMAILNNDVGFFDRPLLPDKRKREEDKRDEGDNAEPSEKKKPRKIEKKARCYTGCSNQPVRCVVDRRGSL